MPYEKMGEVIARMYDRDYAVGRTPSGDVDFYVEEARRSGGPVAEFGCGTGRILIPTAEAGIEIVGVDNSPPMLAQANRKLEGRQLPVTLVEGDMVDHDLGRKFQLVTIPFRAFAHVLEAEDHVRLFRNMGRHFAGDGRLVFDFFHPKLELLARGMEEKVDLEWEEEGRKVRRFASTTPHRSVQVNDVRFRWEIEDPSGGIERLESSFRMRWFYRYEIVHLLGRCGLEIEALYGNFDRSPLEDGSPEMIFVARRAGT
jgi:SAM-dependent methyltransferase